MIKKILFKQYDTGTAIGGIKDIIIRTMSYQGMLSTILIAITAYNTTLKEWFPFIPFWSYVVVAFVIYFIICVVEYKFVTPSTFAWNNRHSYLHSNPVKADFKKVFDILDDMRGIDKKDRTPMDKGSLAAEHKFITDYNTKAVNGRLDLDEFVSNSDRNALKKIANMVDNPNMVIVEVGSWKGNTTSILGKIAKEWNGTVYAVDHWRGNNGTWNKDIATKYDVFKIFRNNMEILGLEDTVKPLVMESSSGVGLFKENSLDIVFLDGNHTYQGIKEDISMWLPKVKNGGIICGHDAEKKYTDFNADIRKEIDKSAIEGVDNLTGICHPGIAKALYEIFNDRYIIYPNSVIWYVEKNIR